jgi:Glycosyltransferases involved in cell wall biogenesis
MTPPDNLLPSKDVTLLMGVHNGAAFLPEQLGSISEQSYPHWHVIFSDDGSTDDTPSVLKNFAAKHPGQVVVKAGPEQGFSANFMQLIRDLPDDPNHVGFADQDDIWMPDKLARGMAALQDSGEDSDALCRAQMVLAARNGSATSLAPDRKVMLFSQCPDRKRCFGKCDPAQSRSSAPCPRRCADDGPRFCP